MAPALLYGRGRHPARGPLDHLGVSLALRLTNQPVVFASPGSRSHPPESASCAHGIALHYRTASAWFTVT